MKKIFKRLEKMDRLIRIKGTGSPREFAEKIGISERQIYCDIEMIRDLGGEIRYSRSRRTYYYEESGGLVLQFIKD